MNAYIDTIKTTDAAGEQVLLYPRTKQSAVEGLEETLNSISADIEELKNGTGLGDTSNLVPNTRTIAGIDLVDDITFDELKETLQYLTETDIAELNTSGVAAYYETDAKTVSVTAYMDTIIDTITLPAGTYIIQGGFRYPSTNLRFLQRLITSTNSLIATSTSYDNAGYVSGIISSIYKCTKETTINYVIYVNEKDVEIDYVRMKAVQVITAEGSPSTAGELKPWLYSEEETISGTYRGKPLYRKVLEPIIITEDMKKYSIEDIPYEYISIDQSMSFSLRNNASFPLTNIGYDTNSDTVAGGATQHAYITSDKTITFRKGNGITSYTAYITLHYTKTTDAEGSGNSLNPYGIYSAKLDDIISRLEAIENIDIAEGGAY